MCRVVGFFTTRQLCSQLNVSVSAERAWRSSSENADHFYPPESMGVRSPSLLLSGSQPPPSVLGSCALLHPHPFKTCGLCASHSRSLTPRTRPNYDYPHDRGNARLSATRREFWTGPLITNRSRYLAPLCGSPRLTFGRIRRSL